MEDLMWREPVKIPDGKKKGEITTITERTEPYHYVDIFVKLDDTDFELKYGCPAVLSENSKLGKVMIAFGCKFEKEGKLNPETALKGKRAEFMTIMRKSKKDGKEYAEIVEDSLKPEVKTEKID